MSTHLPNGRFPLLFLLLIITITPVLGQDNSHPITGKVTDQQGNSLPNVTINACDLNKQPVLLIPGGEGSPSSAEDVDGMAHIARWMRADGYLEGCNLFFASDVSGFQSRQANRLALQGHLRRAYEQVLALNPGWQGHFDLIGHSYGGLLARFYLESAVYNEDKQMGIQVDNLLTLGTPHGGFVVPEEMYPAALIIIGDHLFDPQDEHDFWGAAQLHNVFMDLYNMSHRQPQGVRYHLFAGDFLQQQNVPLALRLLYAPYKDYPGDIAVSQRSAGQLRFSPLLQALYPQTCLFFNQDLHGYKDSFGLGSLQSYVFPERTYQEQMRDVLGRQDTGCPESAIRPDAQLLATAEQPFTPPLLLAEGDLDHNEEVSGVFSLAGSGPTLFSLVSQGGDLQWQLSSPDGQVVEARTLEQTPQMLQDSISGPGSTITTFVIDVSPGQWRYLLRSSQGSGPASYRLTAYQDPDLTRQRFLHQTNDPDSANADQAPSPDGDAGPFQAISDIDGRFTFSELPPGQYLLQAQQDGMIFDPPMQIITIP